MAAIDQATAILEGLANKSLSNPQKIKLIEHFINYRETQGLTPEEKAQEFVDALFILVKNRVKAGATKKVHEDNYAGVLAASAAAIVDL